ncbi:MAG: zinc-binding dehydrogenase, partial [Pseudonocardiaceae bacterium]
MFAVYASEPNPRDPLAALRIGDRPDPDAPEHTVAVTVVAASLNMHDLWTLRGVGIAPERFPMILGCDGAGVLPDGSEVVIYPVLSSPGWTGDETLDPHRALLTETQPGTFADTVVVPARNVVPKPPSLTFPEAACMGTAWLTAYRMLFVKSGLRAGQSMLVQGASGGVSTALVQLGRAAGMRVWVTGRTEGKRELARSLGAHQAFEPGARLPERVDAVFETVGKATWSHSAKSLKPGGIIVCSGATSGDAEQAELRRLFFLQLRMVGSTMGTREELRDLLSFLDITGV